MTPQTRNWVTATLATLLLLVLAVALTGLSGVRSPDSFLQRPSTFFTDNTGARALFLIAKKLLPSAEQWRRPLNFLPISEDRSSATTLIVADPRKPVSKTEAEHLDRWLAKGGQLILATNNGWPLSRTSGETEREVEKIAADKSEKQDSARAGEKTTYLSRHAAHLEWTKRSEARSLRTIGASVPTGELDIHSSQSFSSVDGTRAVASARYGVIAVEIPVGEGRIIAIADPAVISNRALREADNAVWLVTLAAQWGNGGVFFDEYHHGFGQKRGAGDLTWAFLTTPWGWCLSQIVVAGLLYVFGYRRRFGRITEPPPTARTSPLELVDARAGMFRAANAQGLAVELIAQNLCQELGKVCGKPVSLSTLSHAGRFADRASDATRQLTTLRALVSKVERGERLSDREFTEVGQIAGKILEGSVP